MSTNKYLNILGLQPGVSEKEIKTAYRRLAKKYHPDINPGEESRLKFIEINEAYNFLMNVGPSPHEETVSYSYNPSSVTDFEARRAWARAKAEEMEREARQELGVFLRKVNKIIAYFSVFIVIVNLLFLSDMLSDTLPYEVKQFSFTPMTQYGIPVSSVENFQVAEWQLDTYTVYEKNSKDFEAEPDNIVIYTSPIFNKLVDVEFIKSGESRVLFNPANAYKLILFRLIMAITAIIILIFYLTPYYSSNKITLSIVIVFLAVIETFIFLAN